MRERWQIQTAYRVRRYCRKADASTDPLLTRDSTEKVPGMFGILVVCLPSAHTGGDLVISHQSAVRRYSMSQKQPSYSCWYADVTHEVTEVLSGYRLVLTFNLVQKDSPRRPTASNLERVLSAERGGLRDALRSWVSADPVARRAVGQHGELIHLLEHKYTDSNLSFANLKRTDRAKIAALHALKGSVSTTSLLLAWSVQYLGSLHSQDIGDIGTEIGMTMGMTMKLTIVDTEPLRPSCRPT